MNARMPILLRPMLTASIVLASLLASWAPAQCPTAGTIPNFRYVTSTHTFPRQVTYAWDIPAGAPAGAVYRVQRAIAGDYCSTFSSFTVVAETTGTTQTVTLDVPEKAYEFWVRMKDCPSVTSPDVWLDDSFSTPPAPPVITATSTAPGQVTITLVENDARVAAVILERAGADGVFGTIATRFFADICPAGSTQTLVDTGLASGAYSYRAASYNQGARQFVRSNVVNVSVGGGGGEILPAATATVASASGLYGSFFRTSVQLYNPSAGVESGRLVFHARETIGTDGDPFVKYALQPGQTASIADVLAAMGQGGAEAWTS